MVSPHHLIHLARRFFGSLRPGGPPPEDERWATGWLVAGEQALWKQMSGPDRRHAVDVARRVVGALGGAGERPAVAAALLHDCGKIDAGLGTWARAAVTAVELVAGRDRIIERRPSGRPARYLRHDEIGAALLAEAGSDPLTVAWAREHHLPAARWTVPPAIAAALKAADDD